MKSGMMGALTAGGLLLVFSALAADFTGDGSEDVAVFRESSGLWAIRNYTRVYFGSPGDKPAAGDYNCDGKAEIAIFRPTQGLWAVRNLTHVYFGLTGDAHLTGNGNTPWSGSGSDVYYATGKVGIGTAVPNYDLDVNGTIRGASSAYYGVYGRTDGGMNNVYGVYGSADGAAYGVCGYQSGAVAGLGVYGKKEGGGSAVSGLNNGNGNGVWGYSYNYNGVGGGTGRDDNNYGLYTAENLYSANYHLLGAIMQVAENGGGDPLERGDVVAIAGMRVAATKNLSPLLKVRKATGESDFSVIGVVAASYPAEWLNAADGADAEGDDPGRNIPLSVPGPIAPGDFLLVVVQGPALVKASALSGPIKTGDPLVTAGKDGRAAAAFAGEGRREEAPVPGSIFAKSLEPLDSGHDLIYAFVTLH